MKRLIIKYGIVGGLISSALGTLNWLLVARTFGVQVSQALGYISITLSLLCIPFGVRYFRDKLNKEIVSFAQAFKIGLGITIIAAIVMAIHSMLFFAFQKDEFLEWQRNDLSQADLIAFNQQLAQMPEFAYAPWFQGIVMFFMVFLIGAVVNVISALLLRQEKEKSENSI